MRFLSLSTLIILAWAGFTPGLGFASELSSLAQEQNGETSGAPAFTLDIDGDGQQQALTDGLIIIRYLFGFEGDALLSGARSDAATRSDMVAYLDNYRSALDIDGDGEAMALTDGLIIIRYLFGFEGDALISGAIAEGSPRNTAMLVIDQVARISDRDGDGISDFDEDRAPQMTLIGESSIVIVQSGTFTEPGYTAIDREDGDLTSNVLVSGNSALDESTPGTYLLEYSITDSAGQTAMAVREIKVLTTMQSQLVGRWKLAGDGAASVGPSPGSSDWWSSSDISSNGGPANRPCWFDDVYEFKANGEFFNEHGEETFLEDWQAGAFECAPPVAPHDGSSSANYELDEGAQTLTLIGRGAYLGLPKAVNGKELKSPSEAPTDIIYEIDTLSDSELVVYVEAGSGVFWTFRLIREEDVVPEVEVDVFENWVLPTLTGPSSPEQYEGYSLIFRDEFEAEELNPNHWTFDIGTGSNGWGNEELQFYTARNHLVRDGVLVIRAQEEQYGGRQYTSSRLKSQNLFGFTYGRVDIRASLPTGQGLWPALWMLGENFPEVGWPRSGEIDIMEMLGHEDDRVYGTVHWSNNGQNAQYPTSGSGKKLAEGASFHASYHVFSIIWSESQIQWLVDDELYLTFALNGGPGLDAFEKHFFLIMNVAVGGRWPKNPDSNTRFPQEMIVDYVRVFQPTD